MWVRCVRGAHLPEPDTTLALFANRHVPFGRGNNAAPGKKIRRSRSSKLPEQPAKCRNARLKAILFSCNYWQLSINTTNIEIKYPTKADAAGQKSNQSRPEIPSAVILGYTGSQG